METLTFRDIVEKRAGEIFEVFKKHPELLSFVVTGTPVAIAGYLQEVMEKEETKGAEVSVSYTLDGPFGKLMRFGLTANKKGDSIAFMPTFEMLEDGLKYVNADESGFDIEAPDALGVHIKNNELFCDALRQAYNCKVYKEGEWVYNENATEKGLTYDEESDICVSGALIFISLIEIFSEIKDPTADVEYEIPNFAKFKVSPGKNGYTVSAIFDKEYKALCKSDKLAEKVSTLIEA